jgi:hypothetical protein
MGRGERGVGHTGSGDEGGGVGGSSRVRTFEDEVWFGNQKMRKP